MGYIVAAMNRRRQVWPRTATVTVVAIVLALGLAAVVAQCWLPQVHRHAAQPQHPVSTMVGGEFVVKGHHAHLSDNSTPPCPGQSAIAEVPRVTQPAIDSAAVAAIAEPVGAWTYLVVSPVRGPPPWQRSAITGQDLLTRYCLARR